MKQPHDTTKKRAGKSSKTDKAVKYKEGKSVTYIQEQRNRWAEHFKELLNKHSSLNPAPLNPLDIEVAQTDLPMDVTPPRPHDIPAEAMKSDIEVIACMLHVLSMKICEEEQVLTDWKEGHLIKTPKKL
ncbi:unnamed protein product [Schistosoma margrebowiei]|uniref:Uncharacterized protein n=1 Tax=Schistosoma margrebowiei TaxID=48269 RepID=A0A183MA53_9TREM|nr:unnamed protein product [Schistosoma margrebowiei]